MGVLRFYWLRHAPPINPQKLCYGAGDVDVDLSDLAAFKKQSALIPVGATWYVSSSSRTRQTASRLTEMHPDRGIMLHIEPDLIEQSFGDWVGLSYEEMKNHPGFFAYRADPENTAPPNGETLKDLSRRVIPVIYKIVDENRRSGDIALIAHGGTIRAALSEATGIPMKQTLKMSVDPLSLTVITFDHDKKTHGKNPWVFESLNLKP